MDEDDKLCDRMHEIAVEEIRPRLTDEFLETLIEVAQLTYADAWEVCDFIVDCFHFAGKHPPDDLEMRIVKGLDY